MPSRLDIAGNTHPMPMQPMPLKTGAPAGSLARPVERDVPDRDGNGTGELIVLPSSACGPVAAPCRGLAAACHQRWEETATAAQCPLPRPGPPLGLPKHAAAAGHQDRRPPPALPTA